MANNPMLAHGWYYDPKVNGDAYYYDGKDYITEVAIKRGRLVGAFETKDEAIRSFKPKINPYIMRNNPGPRMYMDIVDNLKASLKYAEYASIYGDSRGAGQIEKIKQQGYDVRMKVLFDPDLSDREKNAMMKLLMQIPAPFSYFEKHNLPDVPDPDKKNPLKLFKRTNPNNFSDLIKMSLSDYNRRTIENAAGNALIDREITQRQYDYLMEILDEREMIKRKNPTWQDNPLNTKAHIFISTRLKEMARRGDFDKVPKEKRFLAAQQAMKEAWNIARARGLTKHNPALLRRTWRTIGAALVALVALKLLQR